MNRRERSATPDSSPETTAPIATARRGALLPRIGRSVKPSSASSAGALPSVPSTRSRGGGDDGLSTPELVARLALLPDPADLIAVSRFEDSGHGGGEDGDDGDSIFSDDSYDRTRRGEEEERVAASLRRKLREAALGEAMAGPGRRNGRRARRARRARGLVAAGVAASPAGTGPFLRPYPAHQAQEGVPRSRSDVVLPASLPPPKTAETLSAFLSQSKSRRRAKGDETKAEKSASCGASGLTGCTASCLTGLTPLSRSVAIELVDSGEAAEGGGGETAEAGNKAGGGDGGGCDERGGDYELVAVVPVSPANVPAGSPARTCTSSSTNPASPSSNGSDGTPSFSPAPDAAKDSPATASLSNTETETSSEASSAALEGHEGCELLSLTSGATDGTPESAGADRASEFSVDSSGETTGLEVCRLEERRRRMAVREAIEAVRKAERGPASHGGDHREEGERSATPRTVLLEERGWGHHHRYARYRDGGGRGGEEEEEEDRGGREGPKPPAAPPRRASGEVPADEAELSQVSFASFAPPHNRARVL